MSDKKTTVSLEVEINDLPQILDALNDAVNYTFGENGFEEIQDGLSKVKEQVQRFRPVDDCGQHGMLHTPTCGCQFTPPREWKKVEDLQKGDVVFLNHTEEITVEAVTPVLFDAPRSILSVWRRAELVAIQIDSDGDIMVKKPAPKPTIEYLTYPWNDKQLTVDLDTAVIDAYLEREMQKIRDSYTRNLGQNLAWAMSEDARLGRLRAEEAPKKADDIYTQELAVYLKIGDKFIFEPGGNDRVWEVLSKPKWGYRNFRRHLLVQIRPSGDHGYSEIHEFPVGAKIWRKTT